jgi:PAS domain S-box-containing protein
LDEGHYRLLIDGLADYSIYWLDLNGNVSSWSLGAHKLKGFTEDEVIGRHFSMFYTEQDRAAGVPQKAINKAASGETYRGESLQVRKDGSTFWAEIRIEPIYEPGGTIIGFAKISHDETDRKRAETSLRVSEERLELAWRGAGIGMWDWDLVTNVVTTSETFKQQLGEPPDAEGHLYFDLTARIHPDDRPKMLAAVDAHLKECVPYDVEFRQKTRSGEWKWFRAKGQAQWDSTGTPIRMAGSLDDITESKNRAEDLKASEEKFRNAMQAASIGMALVDLSGRWLEVNDACCRLFGYDESELLASDFQTLTHADDLQADLDLVHRAIAGEIDSYRIEKRYHRKGGRVIWTLLSVSIVRDGKGAPSYFISQIQDISQQKEMDRLKNEFLSVVSHELRTPLTSISASLSLINAGAAGDIPPAVQKMTSIAIHNSERLTLLINDILDIEAIESGGMKFDLQNYSVQELLSQALLDNQSYADKFGVRLTMVPSAVQATVNVDKNRFLQVLANLLSNAIKFSPRGETVRIEWEVSNGMVRVSIVNKGPGIPAEFRTRIFGKFAQADSSSTRPKGGTGLGLNISKQMIERMNGKIGYVSEPDAETIFWIDLQNCAAITA